MKRFIFLAISIVLFITSLVLYILNVRVKTIELTDIFLFVTIILLSFSVTILFTYASRRKIDNLENRLSIWTKLSYHVNQVGDDVFNALPIGVIVYDDNKEIKWTNRFTDSIFGQKIIDKNLKDISKDIFDAVEAKQLEITVEIREEKFDCIIKPNYSAIYLFNVTQREHIKTNYENRTPGIGIIYLDNFDESLVNLDVSEQSSIKGEYLGAIADWVEKFEGYLKPFGDERLVMVTNLYKLEEMIEDKFSILDQIRNISEKHNLKVSLSIGIACWDINYDELGSYAQKAIELAERRGGDQVVVNIQNRKIEYFGAKNDASSKNSKVAARFNAQSLHDIMDDASNVFIMGHAKADLDAFGAVIAVHHMAKSSNTANSYMVIDSDQVDKTVEMVISHVEEMGSEILSAIISTKEALELINKDSLVVIVDTQVAKLVASPEVLEKAQKVAVIDHHRASEEMLPNLVLSYVEPSASSAVELVLEMLTFYSKDAEITPLEATIMYGGLVVDTNEFTFRTGARTFEVAAKLKEYGSDTAQVKIWLRKDLTRTLKINQMLANLELYMDKFAFIPYYEVLDDRVILAQVSDEALKINGIDAAFTISKIDDGSIIGVSARSYHSINVQTIMESIGGGGHLNSAAAQVKDMTVEEVISRLKEIIKLEYDERGEDMKIILLEDIKGRGKQDDIIEVANGYAQHLITKKQAVVASDENILNLNKKKEDRVIAEQEYLNLMKKIQLEIDGKRITIGIKLGQDGKQFGSVTTQKIVDAFKEQNNIVIDKKKVELSSEINSIGIYTAVVNLHKNVKAQFEIHVIEE